MEKIKRILIETYNYSVIKTDKNYITFETEKLKLEELKIKIKTINESTINTIKLYFIGNSKNLGIYRLIVNLNNDFDEDKICNLLSSKNSEKMIVR
jgi:hypothetical protein